LLSFAGRDDASRAPRSDLLPRVYGPTPGPKLERPWNRVDGRDKPGHDAEAMAAA
jgi:hypothetical protein